jgi:hypothetical protein
MPIQKISQSPKFSFFYLLSLIALIFTAIPAGLIAFQLINKWLPDALSGYTVSYASGSLKFGLSALLIAVPVYFWSVNQINRGLLKKELGHKANLRRWLIYFILLVTAVVMLGWLIAIFYRYLDGELTGQFFAKSAVAIVIAAVIFLFYRYDLHRNPQSPTDRRNLRRFAWPVIVVLAALFIAGFTIAESPKQARQRRYDEKLIGNFYQIDSVLSVYYQQNNRLPDTLEPLLVNPYFLDSKAIQTSDGQKIVYESLGETKYQLCATWQTSNLDNNSGLTTIGIEKWPHQSGYQCLEQTIWSEVKGVLAPRPVVQ